MEKRCYFKSPIGYWLVCRDEDGISRIDTRTLYQEEGEREKGKRITDPLLKEACQELKEYFDGRRREFDLPLSIKGTEFQMKVWKALLNIPYGETCSYGDIAKAIKNPKASRAVGMANNRNPIAIIIPCHRVIGSDGSLVGYGGGLEIKEFLLKLEGTRD